MNIDQLQAGPELDALMSELMGSRLTVYDIDSGTGEVLSETRVPSRIHYSSRDEDMAGLIVDRLATQGYAITVYTGQYQDQGARRRCCILRLDDMAAGPVDAIADTRPLAIYRAALKARERWRK